MKSKIIFTLAIVLSGVLSGCATQSRHKTQSDRSHALKAALEHTFSKFDRYYHDGSANDMTYVIEAGEFTSGLVEEFRGHKPAVVTRGGKLSSRCSFWTATIQDMDDDRATIYITFYFWTESQGGYVLGLQREKQQWIVVSDKFSHTGL